MSRTAQVVVLALLTAAAAAVAVVLLAPTSGVFSRGPLLALIAVVAVLFVLVTMLVSRRSDAAAPGKRDDAMIDITERAGTTAPAPGPAGATEPDRSVVYKVVLRDAPGAKRKHGDAWMMWASDMLEQSPVPDDQSVDPPSAGRTD